jgi:hypothetical protein
VGYRRDAFDRRLGEQKSGERIFVVAWEVRYAGGMRACDGQLNVAIVQLGASEQARIDPKGGYAQCVLMATYHTLTGLKYNSLLGSAICV